MRAIVIHNLCITGFEAPILMQTVRKHLLYDYVPIMEKIFRSGTRESCVAQRSIYVMLRGSEKTRSCINRFRNALKLLCSSTVRVYVGIKCQHFRTSLTV